jgi:hypothetical protein
MPTAQSVAVREEQAIERIRQATVTLKARTGATFEDVDLTGRMAAVERQAVTLEQIAAILESLVVVLQEPVQVDDSRSSMSGVGDEPADEEPAQEEAENGSTEQGKRRPSPRRKT